MATALLWATNFLGFKTILSRVSKPGARQLEPSSVC